MAINVTLNKLYLIMEINKPCPRESRKENVKCLTKWLLEGNQESFAAEVPLNLSWISIIRVQAFDILAK